MQEDRDLAARLDLLMDHLEENGEIEEDSRKAQILSDFILHNDEEEGYAKKDFLRCIGLLKTNALEVEMGKARALFPMFSFLSHSCLNNARHVTEKIDDNENDEKESGRSCKATAGTLFHIKLYAQRHIAEGQRLNSK